jgi:hypothetical protein
VVDAAVGVERGDGVEQRRLRAQADVFGQRGNLAPRHDRHRPHARLERQHVGEHLAAQAAARAWPPPSP